MFRDLQKSMLHDPFLLFLNNFDSKVLPLIGQNETEQTHL